MNEAPDDGAGAELAGDPQLEAGLATPSVRVVITGGGAGQVVVTDDFGEILGSCDKTCTLPVATGQLLHIYAATPSVFGGLSGACITADATCELTASAGRSTVTATFGKAPGETFTRFFTDGDLKSAAFDGAGRLVVASSTQLTKLAASGATVWQLPIAVCNLATGPSNTIYAQTATSVLKLAASGAVLWQQPLDPRAVGCGRDNEGFDGFIHNIAVGVDGAVAIHGNTGLARWDRDGNLSWSVALSPDDLLGVAIDPHGVIHAAARNLDNGESLDLRRFTPAGAELPLLESVVAQARGMLVIDPVGRLLVTGSGHSHTDLGARSVHLSDPDFAPNGVAAAASDAAWFHEDNDDSFSARAWTLERVHADGSSTPFAGFFATIPLLGEALGTNPHDVAGALDGRVALVGGFHNVASDRGWVTVYAP